MVDIALYKKINSNIVDSLIQSIDFNYSYQINGVNKTLLVEEFSDTEFTLSSEDGNWACDEFGMIINCEVKFNDIKNLFSINGVAYEDSLIGVSLNIYCAKSKYRKIVKLGTLSVEVENVILESHLTIDPKKVDSNINCKVVCYLERPSSQNTTFLKNNNKGIILGEIYNKQITLEGSSSIFPIVNIHAVGKPLWSFIFDFDDPETDIFIDCAKIVLNTASKDYKLIDAVSSNSYCDRVVIEIFKAAMAQFLLTLKEKDFLPDISSNYSPGTISSFAHYLITKHNIKVDSTENIYKSLNDFFENGEL